MPTQGFLLYICQNTPCSVHQWGVTVSIHVINLYCNMIIICCCSIKAYWVIVMCCYDRCQQAFPDDDYPWQAQLFTQLWIVYTNYLEEAGNLIWHGCLSEYISFLCLNFWKILLFTDCYLHPPICYELLPFYTIVNWFMSITVSLPNNDHQWK